MAKTVPFRNKCISLLLKAKCDVALIFMCLFKESQLKNNIVLT